MGKSKPHWTLQELDELTEHWMSGMTNDQIAAVMERSKLAIVSKLSRLGLTRPKQTGNDAGEWDTLRPCLSCGRAFPSKGPTNRICRDCKNDSGWGHQGITIGLGAGNRMKTSLSEEED